MTALSVVILAAGLGKRMRHGLPKVITQSLNGPMILSVIKTAKQLSPEKIVVVTGHKRELVEEVVHSSPDGAGVTFAVQPEQRGTGHAMQCAMPSLEGASGDILILYGDTPLIKASTLKEFRTKHIETKAELSILTIISDGSTAYGRIVRNADGSVKKIQEAKDCSAEELAIKEVNSGMYLVKLPLLKDALSRLRSDNAQGEFYLTDIVEDAVQRKQTVVTCTIDNQDECQGVNDFYDLSQVNRTIMNERVAELLKNGVQILDPGSVFIEEGISIGAGTVIGPNVQLKGKTSIGARCVIEGTALINDCVVDDGAAIKFSVKMESAHIKTGAHVGPFAHIRPGSILEEDVKVGNFVEVKKSLLRKGAKASHLTYLGDADIGEEANIGAGTITCNYDGINKHKTVIGRDVFIGSNSSLVAPVTINEGATVGAGSVITKDVEAGALAITRAPLKTKSGWRNRSK